MIPRQIIKYFYKNLNVKSERKYKLPLGPPPQGKTTEMRLAGDVHHTAYR